MKRFVFRLQSVLDLRLRAEQQAQIALGAALQRVAEAESEIALLAERRTAALALPVDAPFEARVDARRYADALIRQQAEAERRRKQLLIEAEARRVEMAMASAERRAVEKLRERAWAEYQAEAQRQEQISLDEIASARHQYAQLDNH